MTELSPTAQAAAIERAGGDERATAAALVFLFLFSSIWPETAGVVPAAGTSMRVLVWSTLPVGSGLGSSAALSVRPEHGLSSNTMALITSDCDASMRIHAHVSLWP